ncbi:MAG: SMC family ATPase [Actinomycetota bacterium]|nr:SMC family ATPase [Actinomycetota bacterium]
MRPLVVEMEGFGRYATPTRLDLARISCAVVTGPNGAGKSTILEAVSWALWGMSRWADADAMITAGLDTAVVSVELEAGGERWRVVRSRRRGRKTTLRLERFLGEGRGFGVEADSGVAEVQRAIDAVVGATGPLAAATVLVAQGDAARFSAGSTPAQRKAVLSEILGLERYAAWAEEAREQARTERAVASAQETLCAAARERLLGEEETRAELGRAEAARAEAEARLGEAQDAASAAARAAGEAEAAARSLEELSARLGEGAAARRRRCEAAGLAATRATERVRRLEARVQGAQREVAEGEAGDADPVDAKAAETAVKEAREARRAAQRRYDEATAEARRALDEVRALRERLALHRSGAPECPSCGQALAGEAARRVARRDEAALSEAARRAGEAVAQEKEAAAREGAAGERERLAEERARDAARRALEAAARRAALEAARAALDEASRELAGAKEELEAAVKEADEAAAVDEAETRREAETLDEARRTADALGQRRTDAKRARERAEAAGAEHARLVGLAATLARRLEEAVDARRALGEAERRRDAAERRGRLFATLAEAFGHNGIPSLVYEGVVAELEADATSVLSTLSGGRLSLRLATARETKRGTSVDTLDFVVCDGEEERSYEALSGGERMRVDVALRVGLARLLARRSGAPISMLVVDESFSSLDPEGIAATVECLGALAEEIPLVLAVTHTPAIAEAFPVRIRVSADSDPAISVEEAA